MRREWVWAGVVAYSLVHAGQTISRCSGDASCIVSKCSSGEIYINIIGLGAFVANPGPADASMRK